MRDDIKQILVKELSQKYGSNIDVHGDIIIVKNAAKPNAPIIPEEVDKIINSAGTVSYMRTGQLVYTTNKNNLIIQYNP
ncbi:MAG TPA: hypothetical protein VLG12_03180 [Candidatus Saccharimonadales bacterium]|nr:hypothetical protein [Candidatus Saccharimonadales bacterium]